MYLRFSITNTIASPIAMNRRARPIKAQHSHKYLKPGALARIRDSRITARSHRLNSMCPQIPLHLNDDAQPQVNAANDFPCFVGRFYDAPRCPQRKKLIAAKSVFFISATPPNSAPDSPHMVVDSFSNSNDFLVAN